MRKCSWGCVTEDLYRGGGEDANLVIPDASKSGGESSGPETEVSTVSGKIPKFSRNLSVPSRFGFALKWAPMSASMTSAKTFSLTVTTCRSAKKLDCMIKVKRHAARGKFMCDPEFGTLVIEGRFFCTGLWYNTRSCLKGCFFAPKHADKRYGPGSAWNSSLSAV